jgi:hypothetical protein
MGHDPLNGLLVHHALAELDLGGVDEDAIAAA